MKTEARKTKATQVLEDDMKTIIVFTRLIAAQ